MACVLWNGLVRRVGSKQLMIAIVFTTAIAALVYLIWPVRHLNSLRAACAGGDRIVVDTNPHPQEYRGDYLPETPRFEISGNDHVAKFVGLIELGPASTHRQCKCLGDLLITVCRGSSELATLSIHHDKYLRWRDGPWDSDQPLAPASLSALSSFLTANNCPTPSQAKAVFQTAMKAHEQSGRDMRESP